MVGSEEKVWGREDVHDESQGYKKYQVVNPFDAVDACITFLKASLYGCITSASFTVLENSRHVCKEKSSFTFQT